MKLQFQVSTMQKGFDPVDYFARYPHRYISMHCQDWVMTSLTERHLFRLAVGASVR